MRSKTFYMSNVYYDQRDRVPRSTVHWEICKTNDGDCTDTYLLDMQDECRGICTALRMFKVRPLGSLSWRLEAGPHQLYGMSIMHYKLNSDISVETGVRRDHSIIADLSSGRGCDFGRVKTRYTESQPSGPSQSQDNRRKNFMYWPGCSVPTPMT